MKKIVQIFLKKLTRQVVDRYKPFIIGVTGSTGKTHTKEAIYNVMKDEFSTGKSFNNFNNEFGIPLSIAGFYRNENNLLFWLKVINRLIRLAYFQKDIKFPSYLVLEMGVDKPLDMQELLKIAPINLGVITNIGISHLEKFRTIKNIFQEKTTLIKDLKSDEWAIIYGDDANTLAASKKTKAQVITYGEKKYNTLRAKNVFFSLVRKGEQIISTTSFKLIYKEKILPVNIQGKIGWQQVYSALGGISVGIALKMKLLKIIESLENSSFIPGRLNPILGKYSSIIIDDTYNSSPDSLLNALNTLKNLPAFKKIVVLGDMLELGKEEKKEHQKVGKEAIKCSDLLLTFGERGKIISDTAKKEFFKKRQSVKHFSNKEELINFLKNTIKKFSQNNFKEEGDILILVKGSQGMRMEKIVKEIMQKPCDAKKLLVRQEESWGKIPAIWEY